MSENHCPVHETLLELKAAPTTRRVVHPRSRRLVEEIAPEEVPAEGEAPVEAAATPGPAQPAPTAPAPQPAAPQPVQPPF